MGPRSLSLFLLILGSLDFYLWGQPGVLWVSWAALAFVTGSYYIFLKYTRTGLALRAMVDQPVLATVMGANARGLSLLSWCLAGEPRASPDASCRCA
ncbi:ABC transporter permease subunit, partial [Acetomicrobium sp. S15 = DSM 107314]|uniref:ABC transporter permease subunit n=1 Tax=Acetomicrobium sp. S15 = DSM 107314 TaxID=2529858 RepID=UPI00406BEEEE